MFSIRRDSLILLVQALLLAPAMVLCTCGLLYSVLHWPAPNGWLEFLLGTWGGRILLSPPVVVGGAMIGVFLSLAEVCRVSWERIHESWVFCLTVRPLWWLLGSMFVGGVLLTVIAVYVFVENYVVTPR